MAEIQIRTFVEMMMQVQRLKAEVAELRQELEANKARRKPSSGFFVSPSVQRPKKAV